MNAKGIFWVRCLCADVYTQHVIASGQDVDTSNSQIHLNGGYTDIYLVIRSRDLQHVPGGKCDSSLEPLDTVHTIIVPTVNVLFVLQQLPFGSLNDGLRDGFVRRVRFQWRSRAVSTPPPQRQGCATMQPDRRRTRFHSCSHFTTRCPTTFVHVLSFCQFSSPFCRSIERTTPSEHVGYAMRLRRTHSYGFFTPPGTQN